MEFFISNISIDYFSRKPRTLFLVDGLGAALTTFSLYFVLRPYFNYFGMPTNILMYLSIIALVYGVYSMSCFFLIKNNWSPFLRIIGIGNLLYCILTMTLLYTFYPSLSRLGLTYFIAEILIIGLLIFTEFRVANRLGTEKSNF
jgi:hypothetical protein